MAHVAERMISHYLPLLGGYTVTCCPEPRRVFEYVAEIRPNWFFAPPRMWQKLMAAIQTATAAGASLPELKHRMGIDRIEVGWVGAAPCPPEVIEFFAAIGLPLCEAWGMSESTGLGTLNVPGQIRPGTVGRPHPGVEVVVAPDGEILVRGAVIMAGYHKDPEKTAEMIDANGWLHTGDIGSIDEDGYLRIIDRKKELIINSAGKNMSPANIEAKLKGASTLIGQACVIGDARPFNVALLVLDPDAMRQIASDGAHEPAADPKVAAALREAVAAANARLSRVEQIKRYRVIDGDWEPGGDELTPTMKLKRKAIADKYQTTIGELYRD
jgi:long-subunit acyl-CoA synthetase (AMP-forming)